MIINVIIRNSFAIIFYFWGYFKIINQSVPGALRRLGYKPDEIKDIVMADKLGLRIKLLGITEIINNKLFERVHPCLVKKDNYIGNINGVMNAIILKGYPVGQSILQGEGAGPGPTSSALMSDLLSILRGNIKYPFGIPSRKRKKNYKI